MVGLASSRDSSFRDFRIESSLLRSFSQLGGFLGLIPELDQRLEERIVAGALLQGVFRKDILPKSATLPHQFLDEAQPRCRPRPY